MISPEFYIYLIPHPHPQENKQGDKFRVGVVENPNTVMPSSTLTLGYDNKKATKVSIFSRKPNK